MNKIAVLTTMLALAGSAAAQLQALTPASAPATRPAAQPTDSFKVVKLTVKLPAASQPALKYDFKPRLYQQNSGNAALLYYQAVDQLPKDDNTRERIAELSTRPAKELDANDASTVVYPSATRLLQLGALSEQCEWGFAIREQGHSVVIPSLGTYRTLTRMLVVQIKLDLAKGDFDAAIKNLQAGMMLNRRQGPLVIGQLVGIAGCEIVLGEVEEWASAGGPSLYWALAALPQPLVPINESMRCERDFLYMTIHGLQKARQGDLAPDEWKAMWAGLPKFFETRGMGGGARAPGVLPSLLAMKIYPQAKAAMIQQGKDAKAVEAMPVAQVVITYVLDQYDFWMGEMAKWHSLPYWQAAPGLKRAEAQFQAAVASDPATAVVGVIIPTLSRVKFMEAKLDRRAAALQIIEGIRLYAAGHDGKPPGKLEDMADSPAPIDPITGKSFSYQVDGNSFVLEGPPVAGESNSGLRYEVTIEPAKAK